MMADRRITTAASAVPLEQKTEDRAVLAILGNMRGLNFENFTRLSEILDFDGPAEMMALVKSGLEGRVEK